MVYVGVLGIVDGVLNSGRLAWIEYREGPSGNRRRGTTAKGEPAIVAASLNAVLTGLIGALAGLIAVIASLINP